MSQQIGQTDRTTPATAALERLPTDKGGRYPELTVSSVVFAIILGGLMNAAITYAGLKIGFTIGGSAIAAVLGFGVLRGILRRGTILEVNMAQTIASTVNTTNAGIIFTIPTLVLMGHSIGFGSANFWWITLAATVGAVLGSVYIVPLRKQMIDIDRLRFPSATAVAAILKSPGAGATKSVVLLVGAVVGMIIYAPTVTPMIGLEGFSYTALNWRLPATPAEPGSGRELSPRVDHDHDGRPDLVLEGESFNLGRLLGIPDEIALIFAIAPLSFGAGYLTGRPGLMVLAGGALVSFVINPIAHNLGWLPQSVAPQDVFEYARAAFNRPLGIGLLLGGALMGILVTLPAIVEAIKSVARAGKSRTGGRDEMGLVSLGFVALTCILLLVIILEAVGRTSGEPAGGGVFGGLHPVAARLAVGVVAALWIWFAGIIIAQCTGMTDWSPISGMSILTVVLVLALLGTGQVFAAVLMGSALCVAISCSADMMGDLKTGYIIGASPRKQQVWQVITAAVGPIITMATLLLIMQVNVQRHGEPIGPGTDTEAPQAVALEAVIKGMQGGGDMPYLFYGLGTIVGVLLGLSAFPGLGVLVGISMYLPVHYVLTYGVGCVVNIILAKAKGPAWAENWGVPFCAGLVVGEATLALISSGIVLYQGYQGG